MVVLLIQAIVADASVFDIREGVILAQPTSEAEAIHPVIDDLFLSHAFFLILITSPRFSSFTTFDTSFNRFVSSWSSHFEQKASGSTSLWTAPILPPHLAQYVSHHFFKLPPLRKCQSQDTCCQHECPYEGKACFPAFPSFRWKMESPVVLHRFTFPFQPSTAFRPHTKHMNIYIRSHACVVFSLHLTHHLTVCFMFLPSSPERMFPSHTWYYDPTEIAIRGRKEKTSYIILLELH